MVDGVFSPDAVGELQFHPATGLDPCDVAAVEGSVRRRVLRLFEHAGLLDAEAAENMRHRHRHRYHGVLAPNALMRRAVTARAGQATEAVAHMPPQPGADKRAACSRSPASYLWAALVAPCHSGASIPELATLLPPQP